MARKYQLHGAFPSKAGDSAYEVAQKNGFEGTEQEWLASLVGKTGPQGPAGKDASGEVILYIPQTLTEEQKAQARENIGVDISAEEPTMRVLVDYTVPEESATASKFTFTDDVYPGIANCKTIIVIVVHPEKNSAYGKYGNVKCGNMNAIGFDSSGEFGFVSVATKCNKLWQYGTQKISNPALAARVSVCYGLTPNAPTRLYNEAYEDYDSVTVYSYGQFLLAGTRIIIWGEK